MTLQTEISTRHLTELSLELKRIFTEILKGNQPSVRLQFVKQRNKKRQICSIEFIYPAAWPRVSYHEMNTALLSLYHAGYIFYGPNFVILNQKRILEDD